jgi:ABC-type nitrate/sulfonate/bicarbonate transport system substrate-binding protein
MLWLVLLQTTLTIAVSGPATNPEYWPLWVAQTEGYFAQEKLTVSLTAARAEAGAAEALARGQADLAATSLDAALQLGHVGGAPPKLVVGLTVGPPVVLLIPAAEKDRVQVIGDLVGKTVGIPAPGTPEERTLLTLLAKADIKTPRVTVQSYGERRLAGALESGDVAAAVLPDPYATRMLEGGRAVALVDLRKRDEQIRWLGEATVHAGLFARADMRLTAAQLEPLARALLRAMTRLETAAPEQLARAMPASAVGFGEDFKDRLEGARAIFIRDGWVSLERMQASVALVRGRSTIPAKVSMPRSLDRLLATDALRAVLDARR